MKKFFLLLVALSILSFATTAQALRILNFDNLPKNYYWESASKDNLANYYDGVIFGPTATILEKTVYGYNDTDYPPHSGDAVLMGYPSEHIRVDFDSPTNHVEFWFTAYNSLELEAYDASGVLLTESIFPGSNLTSYDFLEVNWGTFDIAFTLIHDGDANVFTPFTIDDFGYAPVPEPGTMLLFGSGLLGIAAFGRKRFLKMV